MCADADGEMGDAEAAVEWWRKLAEELLPLHMPPEDPQAQPAQPQEPQEGRGAAEPDAAGPDEARAAEPRKPKRAETGEA